jgi:hypothetical protein
VPAGGILYVISDALLSLTLFDGGANSAARLVWPLYAGAQIAIAWGWISGGRAARAPHPPAPRC